jgi:hypothetical protein
LFTEEVAMNVYVVKFDRDIGVYASEEALRRAFGTQSTYKDINGNIEIRIPFNPDVVFIAYKTEVME